MTPLQKSNAERKIPAEKMEVLERLYRQGVPVEEIGRQCGCVTATVCKWARRLGLPMRNRHASEFPAMAIVNAYREGMSVNAIANKLGRICHRTITSVLRDRGVKLRGSNRQWPDLRAECVRMYRAGYFFREIGARLGLTVAQVGERVRSVLGSGKKSDGPNRRDARRLLARQGKTA